MVLTNASSLSRRLVLSPQADCFFFSNVLSSQFALTMTHKLRVFLCTITYCRKSVMYISVKTIRRNTENTRNIPQEPRPNGVIHSRRSLHVTLRVPSTTCRYGNGTDLAFSYLCSFKFTSSTCKNSHVYSFNKQALALWCLLHFAGSTALHQPCIYVWKCFACTNNAYSVVSVGND